VSIVRRDRRGYRTPARGFISGTAKKEDLVKEKPNKKRPGFKFKPGLWVNFGSLSIRDSYFSILLLFT